MKYKTANQAEADKAFEYLTQLVGRHALVEVKKVSPTRSLNQNNYFHLLLSAFGSHFGYTLSECKTLFKREVNPDLFVYEKNDQKFLRSSADVTKDDMVKAIDRFMEYSLEQGYELPKADNPDHIMFMENLIEQNQRYL